MCDSHKRWPHFPRHHCFFPQININFKCNFNMNPNLLFYTCLHPRKLCLEQNESIHRDVSVFSCRQHWKFSRKPSKDSSEVNKTFTFHCRFPCREYLSCYWNKNSKQIFLPFSIVSIPSRFLSEPSWVIQEDVLAFLQPHTLSLNHWKSFVEIFGDFFAFSRLKWNLVVR